MATETALLALVAILGTMGTVFGPMLLAAQLNKARLVEKREDWKRQDAVAAQAEEAARLLLAANERVARATIKTNTKLDVIHTLVNSNMTAAMQAELDATTREVAMMREVVALNEAAGRTPSQEALAAIEATQNKINELSASLQDRLRQTKVAESQIFIAKEVEEEEEATRGSD